MGGGYYFFEWFVNVVCFSDWIEFCYELDKVYGERMIIYVEDI